MLQIEEISETLAFSSILKRLIVLENFSLRTIAQWKAVRANICQLIERDKNYYGKHFV
jgi:hypothetical protein